MASRSYDSLQNCTVYIQRIEPQRLNSQAKIQQLDEAIRALFEDYGEILEVVVKRSIRRKGQAFVVFSTPEEASSAQQDLDGFELADGYPIKTSIARTPSDAVVKKFCPPEVYEKHVADRKAKREADNAFHTAKALEEAQNRKRAAPEIAANTGTTGRPLKSFKPSSKANVIPDEYLPPNKLLVVRNIPLHFTADDITPVFSGFEGFKEVRKLDVGPAHVIGMVFVEYAGLPGAVAAKEALANTEFGGQIMNITYSKA